MKERKYPGFSSNIKLQPQGNYEVIYVLLAVFKQVLIPLEKEKKKKEKKGKE